MSHPPVLSFGLYPNIYATGKLRGLRHMLEHVTRRTEDKGPGKPFIAKGPDLQDHYGKRTRDVDVERI